MSKSFVENNILKIVIGVPIILLLFSFVFYTSSSNTSYSNNNVNEYFESLPSQYFQAYQDSKKNDSTFFCSVSEGLGKRELYVFKAFPSDTEKRLDFNIEIYPTNKVLGKNEATNLSLNLTNDAAIYRHEGKLYGVFRKALPFIYIEKLIVKQKSWEGQINKPFKKINNDFQYQNIKEKNFKFNTNCYLGLYNKMLKKYDIAFLPYSYSIENKSLFQVKPELLEYSQKNNQTIGVIEKANQFWSLLNKKNPALKNNVEFSGKESIKANNLIESYINAQIPLESLINVDKLSSYFALRNVFTSDCGDNMYLLYNVNDNLLEPYFVHSNCTGQISKNVEASRIYDIDFINKYINALNSISQVNLYDELIETNTSFEDELSFINSYNPSNIFDIDVLKINQRIIKKSLDATAEILPELISYKDGEFKVIIKNNSIYPIEIIGLNYKSKQEITTFEEKHKILSKQIDTIKIATPRSFENLFVSKKKKEAGFVLHKDIYDLNIKYMVTTLENTTYLVPISPYQQNQTANENDLFRIKSTVENQKGITINKNEKTISFSSDKITINEPLIIPEGYQFKIAKGVEIDILNGGKIISHGPLNFIGSNEKPIKFMSSDKKGQGIFILSNGVLSTLEHVVFDGLSNPMHGSWGITGAVTFYESPVNMKYVTISNNHCEDALNIVRTTFTIDNCVISNTQSDAFDGDFTEGTIKNSKFNYLGNDGIDVSGSKLKIINVEISNAGDKGLSAGEDSQMIVENVKISNSEIAIAGKDLSIINAKNLEIKNTKLAFTAFQKKPEFGPSNIFVNTVVMEGVETKYLIESTSSMKVDGEKIETTQNVKDRMYGVEFGVSSDKTRNSQ